MEEYNIVCVVFVWLLAWACAGAPISPDMPPIQPKCIDCPEDAAANLRAACNGGRNVTRACCTGVFGLWVSEVVPLDEIEYLAIEPYSCANPSYCLAEIEHGAPHGPRTVTPRDIPAIEAADPEHFFSGARSSCAAISFILCKHIGDRQWQCYAKAAEDDVTIAFTQDLECMYTVDKETGRDLLFVGSCSINQQTERWARDAPPKPYALLSSTNPLSFPLPIINPDAVDALVAQGRAINRIVRRSDVLFAPAFLPPALADHFAALPPSLQRSLLELVQLVFSSAIYTLLCAFAIMLMGALITVGVVWAKMSVLHARLDAVAPQSAAEQSDEPCDSDGEELVSYDLGSSEAPEPDPPTQLYPIAYVPAAAEIEAKV